jgi:Rieske Fe-S protein
MERRSLLKWAIRGLGALFGAVLGLPALAYLTDARNRRAPEGDFRTVGRLSDLQVGVPHQVVIRDIRRDAWTLHPNDVVGRVWLLRRADDGVDAFTTICPHLGCSINFQPADQLFVCPCHNGTYDLNGRRYERPGATNPAPRGMDALEVRVENDPATPGKKKKDGLIAVKYQNFIQGKDTAVPKS